uniref:PiggyBac transposable element-derived protein domain-containing protein n=1 Tax=Phytophthora ramorum TaxID=164328 RepID=H3H558_PHYRM
MSRRTAPRRCRHPRRRLPPPVAAGWTAKRPSGLVNDWTYTIPDGSSHFIDEAAVMAHALTSGLLNENAQDKNEQGDTAQHKQVESMQHETDETENAQDKIEKNESALHLSASNDDARPSQVDTSVMLTQGTLDTLFGQASDNEDAAVPATGRALAERGDQGIWTVAERAPAGRARAEEEQKTDEPRAVLRRGVKVVVNYLAVDEHSSDYESFSSGESDDGQIEDDDQEPDREYNDLDDDFVSDSDAVEIDEAFFGSLMIGASDQDNGLGRRPSSRTGRMTAYDGMHGEDAHPVAELREVCHSPVLTCLYFMPKSLRVAITEQTNKYAVQQVDRRAEEQHVKQREGRCETVQQIRRRLKSKKGYDTHEILHVVGLLVTRMLCPQQRRFAAHWSMVEDGAVPAGNFGRFDEGVLPSTSRWNTTRMFMPDKPHRYGSKMFMTCDSLTAYCNRFEIYAGKHRHDAKGGASPYDHKTGAAAVVCNLKVVLTSNRHKWHVVVVDRFYSSVLLCVELLAMNVYVVGTVMTNRLGLDPALEEGRTTRPASIPRGTFKFARSVAIPSMVMFHWWDRKPVHYLCTGAIITESTIGRKVKQLGAITVPCPQAVTDYQRWMGGVDVHDQLRLQKSLFFGFVDLALVNAFLSHKEAAAMDGKPAMKRGVWFGVLQNQLLQLKSSDFAGVVATPLSGSQKRQRTHIRVTHQLEQRNDWVTVGGVCELLRVDAKKSFSITFFCERCSLDDAKLWLCNNIRRQYDGVNKTCFDIWHDDFDAGESIPATLGKHVVLRHPGQRAGKRKRTRRELRLAGDRERSSDKDSDDSDFVDCARR